ncbi:MAG: tetratricopeptide repeat protein [Spirochaetales bacterium]|nr:MAG: tetratricopeptide repeat protein [Spirochaetales bacterium]
MMSGKTGLLIACLLLVSALQIPAQEPSDEPPWLVLEYGKMSFDRGEYGQALRFFRQAIEKQALFPEAEMWIGAVFEEEGEYELAEKQYRRAYEMRNLLYVPEEKYAIMYNLSRIYYFGGKYSKYEEMLQTIIRDDVQFKDRNSELPFLFVKNMKESGIDKVLSLYRVNVTFSLNAHSQMGIFYYKTGRFDRATLHLAYSAVLLCSRFLDELKKSDPDFKFRSLAESLTLLQKHPMLKEYLLDVEGFQVLYYLGAALYAEGAPVHAAALWTLVSEWSPQAVWKDRSLKKLRSPYIEPLLNLGN